MVPLVLHLITWLTGDGSNRNGPFQILEDLEEMKNILISGFVKELITLAALSANDCSSAAILQVVRHIVQGVSEATGDAHPSNLS